MKDIVLIVIHLAVTAAKLFGPGGMRGVVAENVLLKQQLIVLRRSPTTCSKSIGVGPFPVRLRLTISEPRTHP